ncbi:putative RNA polymerase sigma factor FecI [compost metagenome]
MNVPPPADSLDTLYKGYHGWLLGWLRRRLDCPHNAADLAQDTFVRLLSAGAYVAPREPRAFLATVARRLLVDRSRRQKLEQAYREELAARQVFILRHLEGLSHAQIAERFQVSSKTVQNDLVQALLQCHAASESAR